MDRIAVHRLAHQNSVLIALVIAVVAAASPVLAATARPCRPIDHLRLFEDSKVDFSSQVYRQGPYFLVVPAAGDQLYVLDKESLKVRVFERTAVPVEDGAPVLGDEAIESAPQAATYEKEDRGRWLVWKLGDTALAVGPKPELIGEVSREQVLAEKEQYREKADAYVPQSSAIETIGDAADLRFVVGFGTWCPTCAEWTPRFIKTFEAAGLDDTQLVFVAVDPEYKEPADALARYKIEAVPTFIVYRGDHELGRVRLADLDRDPDTPIELRLARIIDGKES